jgi:uncharacterized OB-fold protein
MDIVRNFWSSDIPPKLLGSKNLSSNEIIFPPLPADSPIAQLYVLEELEPVGVLYTFTIIHPSAKSGLPPFSLGFINLQSSQARIFGRLVQEGRPNIGDLYRIEHDAEFGYVFKLMDSN